MGSSSDLIQNLKPKIEWPVPLLATMLVMTTAGTQADLGNFGSDESHSPEGPPEPDVKTSPGDDDDQDPDTDDEHSEEDEQEDDSPIGIIYARVSSEGQRKGQATMEMVTMWMTMTKVSMRVVSKDRSRS